MWKVILRSSWILRRSKKRRILDLDGGFDFYGMLDNLVGKMLRLMGYRTYFLMNLEKFQLEFVQKYCFWKCFYLFVCG